MKKNTKHNGIAVMAAMLLAGAAFNAGAQVSVTASSMTYTQDFNTLENGSASNYTLLPDGWAIHEMGANANGQYRAGTGSLTTGDTWSFGTIAATERALGGLASNNLRSSFGVRFVNNTGAFITNVAISFKGEQWRMGGGPTPVQDTLAFSFSTVATDVSDAGAHWNDVPALNFTSLVTGAPASAGAALDGNAAANSSTISGDLPVAIPAGGSIILKWTDINIAGNDDGLAIDDLSVTFTTGTPPMNTHLILQGKLPAHDATNVPLATDKLVMVFDDAVIEGTGSIHLNGGAAPQVFTLPSAAVSFSNDSVIIEGISLAHNTSYHVRYDATVATNTSGAISSAGIYDDTTWVFSTEDSTTTPPPPPLTALDETFADCGLNGGMGVFTQYNELGADRRWRCANTGRTDDRSVYMNGGPGGGSEANKDWLISNAPLDCSAMTGPALSFYQKRRFSGSVTRSVSVSTDHVAGKDPALATWTAIDIPAFSTDPDTTWSVVNNIDLNAHKGTPFYLAFIYESAATGSAWEWSLDDIRLADVTRIRPVGDAAIGIRVLGEATGSRIDLSIDMKGNGQVELELFDLPGRKVAGRRVDLVNGPNRISISELNLVAGLYIIRVTGADGYGAVKAVVK